MDVTIVGTGQMAVMCATLLRDNGHGVRLVGRADTIKQMSRTRESPQLPGVPISRSVELVDADAIAREHVHALDGRMVVMAVPTQAVRAASAELTNRSPGLVVSCSKGLELRTMARPSEVVGEVFAGSDVVALSGPNIAAEVVARKPAGAVVACADAAVAERVRDAFATDYFRVYTSDDVVGVELAGATKNVIALAAGIVDGLGLGNNAKASLVTRGLVEITRLGVALGARPETFAGLAGMGDLITTCVSPEGRNRRVGEMVGRGMTADAATAELGSVCEGVPTTRAVLSLAGRHGVEMPICRAVARVLFDGADVRRVLLDLMTREPKAEAAA